MSNRRNVAAKVEVPAAKKLAPMLLTCLSVHQPWANLIAQGTKTIEVRAWPTKHRGPLGICSTARSDQEPRGCLVAIVNLIDCRTFTPADVKAACCEYEPGHQAWVLELVKATKPYPVRGQQGLYQRLIEEAWLDNDPAIQMP